MNQIIRLTLTPQEGVMIAVMLQAAVEQYEVASIEERNDPDMVVAYEIWTKLLKLLPSVEGK